MSDIYLPSEEAATIEGIDYFTFTKRYERENSKYAYKIKREASEHVGGKDRVFVALSSLSKKARNLYRERQKVDISKINEPKDETAAPWYVHADWAWYKENHKKHYNKAIEMSRHVKDCLEYDGWKDKTVYITEYAGEIGISARTFYRKIEQYTEASAWALEMSKNEKANYEYFKILSLCPTPREPVGRRSLTDEMKAVIENIWFDPDFAVNLCKYAKLYRKFCAYGESKGWDRESIPSYDTICRYINDIRETTDNARLLLERGEREWKRTAMVKRRRDLSPLRVMEVVVTDTHTFDCFVTVTASNGKTRIIKPCLVGFMDMRSRSLVGWGICEIPNSQIIKETMIHMVMEKKNPNNPFQGVCRVLLIDNGKDYTARSLTGKPRNVRVELDEDVFAFYNEVGIEKEMRSLPYQPWTKAEIERYFGTVCEDFTKDMKSYVGTLTGSKTSAKVIKNIKQLYERGELLDINEFAERFENWVLNVYSKRNHGGLKEQKEKYKTPLEVYLNEERYDKPAPPLAYLERMAMVRVERQVYATGIRLFNCDYMDDRLTQYINSKRKVVVRYNPKDVRKIYVFDPETKKPICEARAVELLNVLAEVDDATLAEHLKSQKRQLRKAKETINYYQSTYEERLTSNSIESKQKALVVPEIAGAAEQKIVSMPHGRYVKNMPVSQKAEEPEMNEWMRAQAEKALKEIRKISNA